MVKFIYAFFKASGSFNIGNKFMIEKPLFKATNAFMSYILSDFASITNGARDRLPTTLPSSITSAKISDKAICIAGLWIPSLKSTPTEYSPLGAIDSNSNDVGRISLILPQLARDKMAVLTNSNNLYEKLFTDTFIYT